MNSIKISAPAKVNLFLKVLNKRKDGYHNIHTLFERISLTDTITLIKRPSGIVVTSDKFITRDPKDNIAYKAADLILKYAKKGSRVNPLRGGSTSLRTGQGSRTGVSIHIKKNIPIAAGLGGGSSDAASVLIGLNKLFNIKLTNKKLMDLAGQLGADVSFFLLNTPFAIGTGKGEKLKKSHIRAQLWHLIINPGFKMPTKDIYKAYDNRRPKGLTTKLRDVKIQHSLTNSFDHKSLEDMLYNDLEEIAISKKKVLGNIIERLASHLGRKAIVSGSGPSVFCLYETGKEVRAAKDKLFRNVPSARRKSWKVFVASTLN